jgi:hypothetical protein
MAEDASDGEAILLEKPERGAKDGYLQMFYNSSNSLNGVIRESNGISDHRIRLMTLKMIGGITDDTIRAKTFEFFEHKIKEIHDHTDWSADKKNEEIANFCCGEMQGHITSFYDQFLGITHRLKLGGV